MTQKDYTNKLLAKRQMRAIKSRWQVPLVLVVFILLLGGAAFFIYKKKVFQSEIVSTYVARAATWIAAHRHHVTEKLVKTKQMAAGKGEEENAIHFEFYTTLPNMQMAAAEISKNNATATVSTEHVTNGKTEAMAQAAASSFIDAEDLEHEISEQLKHDAYVIQLGVFKNAAAAEHYRQFLVKAGFKANVVKMSQAEKETYRVQLGPFANKEEVKLIEHQLQKKGMNGLIKKVV